MVENGSKQLYGFDGNEAEDFVALVRYRCNHTITSSKRIGKLRMMS